VITPRFDQIADTLESIVAEMQKPPLGDDDDVEKLVVDNLLKFVYYSNYGNLDSEIYLPHVIDNMKRKDLGTKEAAKVRTLRVLFDFVRLSPKEVMELGEEPQRPTHNPLTDNELKKIAEQKKERDILLQSAGTLLTQRFREWWKQGEYRFRFQADGNHFRIWVSDDKRPEDIELEGRSAGLQWFLSFYLIFLVESEEAHRGTMLLLDEPGHSLHPLAQEDLSAFFENLAGTNQIAYTTHSPFLVDSDHLDRVKAVYSDESGATTVSANLRAAESNRSRSSSIYPVHAALGLSVSTVLFQGCKIVVVEGPADQRYLTAIKNVLIARNRITPPYDLLFVPAGGAKGIAAVAGIVAGRNGNLPYAILDSDRIGESTAATLASGLYAGQESRLVRLKSITGLDGAEVEDLFPLGDLESAVARYARPQTVDDSIFENVLNTGAPVVGQMEAIAASNNIELVPGWKVMVADVVKARLEKAPESVPDESLDMWTKLFEAIVAV
jgi:hypothetical protein